MRTKESMGELCCQCNRRRGQHRYGDEACPDPRWKVGNGMPEWHERRCFWPAQPAPTLRAVTHG